MDRSSYYSVSNIWRIFKPASILLLIFLSAFPLTAQKDACTFSSPGRHQLKLMTKAANHLNSQRSSGAVKHLAIKPIVVRRNDGSGGVSLSDLNQVLADINNTFRGLNVEFYFGDIKYVDNARFLTLMTMMKIYWLRIMTPTIPSIYIF
jgi:hypothetical protein